MSRLVSLLVGWITSNPQRLIDIITSMLEHKAPSEKKSGK